MTQPTLDPAVPTPAPAPARGLRALAVVRGWPAARQHVREWLSNPFPVLAPWIALATCIALVLLALVWIVGVSSPADPTRLNLRRLLEVHDDWAGEAWHLFRNNLLVLALHAAACLAGFIVHLALTDPVEGEHPRIAAWSRSLAIVAVAFVPIATILSIATQAWVLGARAATLADQLHLPVFVVLRTTATHSLPELAAVFLPLAASLYLVARRRPDQLLAATVVTVVLAIPVIGIAAVTEARVWPGRLGDARDAHPHLEGRMLGTLQVDPADHFSAEARLFAGPQLDDEVHGDRPAAIEVAGRHRGGAAVVLQVRDGYVAHQLLAERRPHHCETLSGMRVQDEPMSLAEIERLRWPVRLTWQPELAAFVDGARVVLPAQLVAPPIERQFFGECR